jgi:HPr kinase/phosphorylase
LNEPLKNLTLQRKKSYPVQDFFSRYEKELHLTLCTSPESLNSEITEPHLHRPGLAMSGYTDVYSHQRIQLIGTTEWSFLEAVGPEKRIEIFEKLSVFRSPLWVLTHQFRPHPELLALCEKQNLPVMITEDSTLKFSRNLQKILEEWFAPYTAVHASLVDVYGVGMLYTGASNIGKSECVLDLVERGHRLVADDVVKLMRLGDSIVGKNNTIINHHMEIRGVGIIDIKSMFGIHAVRSIKKVEIIVELQYWNENSIYDRTGLDNKNISIMGIDIPKVLIPVSPGKNITVISEVIAMNALMKLDGIDSATEFNKSLLKAISEKRDGKSPAEDSLLNTDFYE